MALKGYYELLEELCSYERDRRWESGNPQYASHGTSAIVIDENSDGTFLEAVRSMLAAWEKRNGA